jgi:hypothetical protein
MHHYRGFPLVRHNSVVESNHTCASSALASSKRWLTTVSDSAATASEALSSSTAFSSSSLFGVGE